METEYLFNLLWEKLSIFLQCETNIFMFFYFRVASRKYGWFILKLISAHPRWLTDNDSMNCDRASLISIKHVKNILTLTEVVSTYKN